MIANVERFPFGVNGSSLVKTDGGCGEESGISPRYEDEVPVP